jgi:hypothetical protein
LSIAGFIRFTAAFSVQATTRCLPRQGEESAACFIAHEVAESTHRNRFTRRRRVSERPGEQILGARGRAQIAGDAAGRSATFRLVVPVGELFEQAGETSAYNPSLDSVPSPFGTTPLLSRRGPPAPWVVLAVAASSRHAAFLPGG